MQNSKPIVFVDVDGVLLSWCEGFWKYLGRPYSEYVQPNSFDLVEAGWFTNMNEMINALREFNSLDDFAERVKPIQYSQFIYDIAKIADVRIMSQCAPTNRVRRCAHMIALYGNIFTSFNYTQHGESKVDFIIDAVFPKGVMIDYPVYLIEDKAETLNDAWASPINPIGIKANYNTGKVIDGIPMFNNMAHVWGYIRGRLDRGISDHLKAPVDPVEDFG